MEAGVKPARIDAMIRFVETGADETLYRIRIKTLAREWRA